MCILPPLCYNRKWQNLCIMQLITDLYITMQLITDLYIEMQSITDFKRKSRLASFMVNENCTSPAGTQSYSRCTSQQGVQSDIPEI